MLERKAALPRMPEAPPIKLIYIAGYGRSGSTLLDIALGQHPNVLGAGEISPLTRHVWENDEYCACSKRVRSCPFWSSVMSEWAPDLPAYLGEQKGSESILGGRRTSGDFATRTRTLLGILESCSGKAIVVDSSKLPGRGFALASTPGIELYVVHLVRDPRAVVWSMMKPMKRQVEAGVQKELRPKPLLYTALRWLIVNFATDALTAKLGRDRSIRVRYEDFVAAPSETLRQILHLVGEQSDGLPDGISAPFRPQHQVAGSRHRMQKELSIRIDERWRSDMPSVRQWAVALLCAPLLRRYGYGWRPRETAQLREALAS